MGINSLEVGPPVNMTVFQPWASFKAQTLSTIQVLLLCFCSISCKQLGSFIPLWTKSCAGNSPTQSIGLPLLCRPTRISNSLSWSIDMFSKKKTVGLQWEICKDCTCISFFDLKGNPMLNRIGLPTPHLPSSLVAQPSKLHLHDGCCAPICLFEGWFLKARSLFSCCFKRKTCIQGKLSTTHL